MKLLLLSISLCMPLSASAGSIDQVQIYRKGLASALDYAGAHPDLFPPRNLESKRMLDQGQKESVRGLWKSFLDYLLALDSIGAHSAFLRLKGPERDRALSVAYAAFLAQYRWAMEFIEAADRDPSLAVILDEEVPELGLPAGAYAKLRFRFLNVLCAAQFAAYEAAARAPGVRLEEALGPGIEEDSSRIWGFGKGRGEGMTLKNGLAMLRKAGFTAVFPVQSGVAGWMGDTKVYRKHRSLISLEQIAAVREQLEPGDVMLVRREWFLSNVGLPGFWPHATIYIGTPDERRRYFDDPEVKGWAGSQGAADRGLETLLSAAHPESYKKGLEPEHGHAPRVMEAMSEGVSFTSLEHSLDADSAVALRPRLSKKEKARALLRAFGYAGRPYDFDFDFATDKALVCTELVYKSYEPGAGMNGLGVPMMNEDHSLALHTLLHDSH
ncbi:MAG: hypothetical protein HY922_05075 [Elusimicrobia bacterium]|nr:hypothetical protein [Elusimicrobiota bacterium]